MDKIYKELKTGYGECPVCEGTGQVPISEEDARYSWNKGKTHTDCRNCGGQTMYGRPSGVTRLREDNTPCKHEYTSRNAGRCLTSYTCNHCDYSYNIDSSG